MNTYPYIYREFAIRVRNTIVTRFDNHAICYFHLVIQSAEKDITAYKISELQDILK
jgi:hypothetical protein